MVIPSKINKDVVYKENKAIDPEDFGAKSSVYELDILGKTIAIVVGKPKYTYTEKGVVYFPIYAVAKEKVRGQIGVFEIESSKILNTFHNGELDIDRLDEPVLYGFVDLPYLAKLDSDPLRFISSPIVEPTKNPEQPNVELDIGEDEEDPFKLRVKPGRLSQEKTRAQTILADGIFIDDPSETMEPLLEETEKDANEIKKSYQESAKNSWIVKFMKNTNYKVHENEGHGDSFFAVVRDAFMQAGKKTSIDKLRNILADQITDKEFGKYRSLYLQFSDNIRNIEREMDDLKKSIGEYKTRIRQTGQTAADTQMLITKANEMAVKYGALKKEKEAVEKDQKEYAGFVKDIDTLEKMRAYMKTASWAIDSWGISTLERSLNVKFIVFSESSFEENATNSVLQCGEVDEYFQERQYFTPDYYIMVASIGAGKEYKLISYKNKKIFGFVEVPFDVKMLILNKCLEHNSGPFYMIQDIRNLKTKYGIDEDEGKPVDYEDQPDSGDLYDPKVVFSFYPNSEKTAKPGKGDGEKIPVERQSDFVGLAKIVDWRKMLSDSWSGTPIYVDNHYWTSVEHYVEGSKYKKGHPDIYLMFSLDSKTDISKDIKLAKAFKGLKPEDGKRVKPIKPDVEYALGKKEEERELAIESKFTKNEDMKRMLINTKNAMLMYREKRGEEAQPDIPLMRLRAKLLR
jgi:hypothetical protein